MKKIILIPLIFFLVLSNCGKKESPKNDNPVSNSEITVKMYRLVQGMNANNPENFVGNIKFQDTANGLLISPDLTAITPGMHGIHIHMNPSCDSASKKEQDDLILGLAAGGHYDPMQTGVHSGPYDKSGHKGDLPSLYADSDGKANLVSLAPKLTTKDLSNRSVVIHAGSDNYSDQPKALGGGGAREFCGVIVVY